MSGVTSDDALQMVEQHFYDKRGRIAIRLRKTIHQTNS